MTAVHVLEQEAVLYRVTVRKSQHSLTGTPFEEVGARNAMAGEKKGPTLLSLRLLSPSTTDAQDHLSLRLEHDLECRVCVPALKAKDPGNLLPQVISNHSSGIFNS